MNPMSRKIILLTGCLLLLFILISGGCETPHSPADPSVTSSPSIESLSPNEAMSAAKSSGLQWIPADSSADYYCSFWMSGAHHENLEEDRSWTMQPVLTDDIIRAAGDRPSRLHYKKRNANGEVIRTAQCVLPDSVDGLTMVLDYLNSQNRLESGPSSGIMSSSSSDCPDDTENDWEWTEEGWVLVVTASPCGDGGGGGDGGCIDPSGDNCSGEGGEGGGGDGSGGGSTCQGDGCISEGVIANFFSDYGILFTSDEEAFIRVHPWLIPYLQSFIQNGGKNHPGDWPDLGLVKNFFMRVAFDHPEEALFFERYVTGNGEDWHLSSTMCSDIIAEGETYHSYSSAPKNYNSPQGEYSRKFSLNQTSSKYELGLGTFTAYYDSDDTPIGLYDEYDFDWHTAEFRDYTGDGYVDVEIWENRSVFGFTDRGFFNEWVTRGMSGAGAFFGGENYKIFCP